MKTIKITLAVAKLTKTLLLNKRIHTATMFLSENSVVRVTRVHYKNGAGRGSEHIVVSIGRPNYKAREFFKKSKKLGEFPTWQVQLNYLRDK